MRRNASSKNRQNAFLCDPLQTLGEIALSSKFLNVLFEYTKLLGFLIFKKKSALKLPATPND